MRLVISAWQRLPRRCAFSTHRVLRQDVTTRRALYYPQFNPLDIFKKHIADSVSNSLGIDATTVYRNLRHTRTLESGDLKLTIPALKLQGQDPQHVATKLAEQVCNYQL
jgi:hypothetical protein